MADYIESGAVVPPVETTHRESFDEMIAQRMLSTLNTMISLITEGRFPFQISLDANSRLQYYIHQIYKKDISPNIPEVSVTVKTYHKTEFNEDSLGGYRKGYPGERAMNQTPSHLKNETSLTGGVLYVHSEVISPEDHSQGYLINLLHKHWLYLQTRASSDVVDPLDRLLLDVGPEKFARSMKTFTTMHAKYGNDYANRYTSSPYELHLYNERHDETLHEIIMKFDMQGRLVRAVVIREMREEENRFLLHTMLVFRNQELVYFMQQEPDGTFFQRNGIYLIPPWIYEAYTDYLVGNRIEPCNIQDSDVLRWCFERARRGRLYAPIAKIHVYRLPHRSINNYSRYTPNDLAFRRQIDEKKLRILLATRTKKEKIQGFRWRKGRKPYVGNSSIFRDNGSIYLIDNRNKRMLTEDEGKRLLWEWGM